MPTKLTPEEDEAARLAYLAGTTRADMAARFGISLTWIDRAILRWGVPHRQPATARPTRGFAAAPGDAPLRQRIERLLGHRIGLLEEEAACGRGIDPEANARAIAANTRTLALLRRLPPEPRQVTGDDEPPPRTLSELRDELRRHLERIAEEERTRPLPQRPQAVRDREDAGSLADPLPDGAAAA